MVTWMYESSKNAGEPHNFSRTKMPVSPYPQSQTLYIINSLHKRLCLSSSFAPSCSVCPEVPFSRSLSLSTSSFSQEGRKRRKRAERKLMAVSRASLGFVAVMAVIFSILLPAAHAESAAPAPAPTSDGTTIDQGIAYVLMLVALVLTYLIHSLDASLSSPYKLF